MLREILGFTGIRPRLNAALLNDNEAQTAQNCSFQQGDLRAFLDPQLITSIADRGDTIKTIYRMGQTLGESQYWLAWTSDVDVVRGMVAGDTSERTYFTGSGVPKVTNVTLATTGGTSYPQAAYNLGIPKPAAAPFLAPSGGTTDAQNETRVYVYTYVSAWGEEGRPSDPTTCVVKSDGTVAISGMSTGPAGAYNISAKRIYRAQQSASGDAALLFVAEVAVATTTYTDNKAGTALGEEISTIGYAEPPADMAGLTALPNGIMAGFSGYDVYFCEPYLGYAWPDKYRLSCDSLIVGLEAFGATLVVLTKDFPYLVAGTHPENMSMERMALPQACVSKRSIVKCDDGVLYASPDGLVYVGATGARVVTDEYFTRDQWQNFQPEYLSGFWHDGRYIGFFDPDVVGGTMVLDMRSGKPEITLMNSSFRAAYVDPVKDALYLSNGATITKFNSGSTSSPYTWRSKKFMHNGRVPHAFAMVDADTYPVTFRMYWDGVLVQTATVADNAPFALVGDSRPTRLEVQIEGTAAVRYVAMADTVEELRHG